MEMMGINEKSNWNVMEVDLGLIVNGEVKSFDLPFFNSRLIQELLLSATTSGLFTLTVYSRQSKDTQDLVWQGDSSETNQVAKYDRLRYDDLDKKATLYIKVGNASGASMNFNLVVKYD